MSDETTVISVRVPVDAIKTLRKNNISARSCIVEKVNFLENPISCMSDDQLDSFSDAEINQRVVELASRMTPIEKEITAQKDRLASLKQIEAAQISLLKERVRSQTAPLEEAIALNTDILQKTEVDWKRISRIRRARELASFSETALAEMSLEERDKKILEEYKKKQPRLPVSSS